MDLKLLKDDLTEQLRLNIDKFSKDEYKDKQELDNLVEKSAKLSAQIELLNLIKGK